MRLYKQKCLINKILRRNKEQVEVTTVAFVELGIEHVKDIYGKIWKKGYVDKTCVTL